MVRLVFYMDTILVSIATQSRVFYILSQSSVIGRYRIHIERECDLHVLNIMAASL